MKDERHNYEYQVDTSSETGPANVVRMVGQNKRVVEIGCGPGSITKILATQGQCKITGLEIDVEAIEKAKPYCEKIFQADLNSKDWPRLLDNFERFDVVLAADVLEHLYDPWTALQRMVSLINPEGYLVISLPHIGHASVLGCLMNGDFDYHDWGLLDRTHIRFFCLKNIEDLFAQANLKIIDVSYVIKHPAETEFVSSWVKLSSDVQAALMSSTHAGIYQVIVKAVPINYAGDVVSLVAPKPKYKPALFLYIAIWKTRLLQLGQNLSPQCKTNIRKILGLVGVKL
jgi:2-polyprenyl-3-methyl-5-hydroxy-6-metoxy-1,4-benzoquinol methylase